MPQKIPSACLHDSRIDTYDLYLIYFHIWMRPRTDLEISEMHAFFSTVIEHIWTVSHMSKKSELGRI